MNSWDDLAKFLAVEIPPTTQPFSYVTLSKWVKEWAEGPIEGVETPLPPAEEKKEEPPIDNIGESGRVVIGNTKGKTYGKVTLFPEQQAVVNVLVEKYKKGEKSFLNDGDTGSGKTYIAGAFICELLALGVGDNPFKTAPIQIYTAKTVRQSYRKVLREMGILDKCQVMSYSDLTSSTATGMFKKKEDFYQEGVLHYDWFPTAIPDIVIFDECHKLMNVDSQCTKAARGMYVTKQHPITLHMSATPFVKVNDAGTFVVSMRKAFPQLGYGQVVTSPGFKDFAQIICEEPDKPNTAAMKRLKEALSSNVISTPRVKWPSWQVNASWVVDFENDRDREVYNSAFRRYQENCKKSGKNSDFGSLEFWVLLTQFRKTVEPLRAPAIVRRILSNIDNRKVTVVASAFKQIIISILFEMIEKKLLTRKQISVIWGGMKKFRPELVLSRERLDYLVKHMHEWTDQDRICVEETLRFMDDQLFNDETPEEQEYRHNKLREFGLFSAQNEIQRQLEVDKCQEGEAKLVLMTLAAGGVGLSLDRNNPSLWERELLITPVYNGREVRQGMGRLNRRKTEPGPVYQYVTYMGGTYEETHVMPRMEEKFACLGAFSGKNMFIAPDPNEEVKAIARRTREQIERDAQLDGSQVSGAASPEEEEEEEDES